MTGQDCAVTYNLIKIPTQHRYTPPPTHTPLPPHPPRRGVEAGAVAEVERGRGWEPGREDGIGEDVEEAKKRKKPQKSFIRHHALYSARIILLQAGGSACGHPTAPLARPGGRTHASNQGGNRV